MSHRFNLSRGNAPAEFVLVGTLMVALALGVMHVALIIHVRHVLHASAWEGARYASYYGTTFQEGRALTTGLINDALSESYSTNVSVSSANVGGEPGVQVQVRAPIPTIGLWSLGGDMNVEAAVPLEWPG